MKEKQFCINENSFEKIRFAFKHFNFAYFLTNLVNLNANVLSWFKSVKLVLEILLLRVVHGEGVKIWCWKSDPLSS